MSDYDSDYVSSILTHLPRPIVLMASKDYGFAYNQPFKTDNWCTTKNCLRCYFKKFSSSGRYRKSTAMVNGSNSASKITIEISHDVSASIRCSAVFKNAQQLKKVCKEICSNVY